jgi:hypothetical protein
MAQLATAILSHQDELATKARLFTGDVNEAGLLVGHVVSRAFDTFDADAHADDISQHLRGDLEQMIQQLKRRRR